jgi:hypothetical protein
MCTTINIEAGKSAGKPAVNSFKAWIPPDDAPMAMISRI